LTGHLFFFTFDITFIPQIVTTYICLINLLLHFYPLSSIFPCEKAQQHAKPKQLIAIFSHYVTAWPDWSNESYFLLSEPFVWN